MDERLSGWALSLDGRGWAACLLDGAQNLVWASSEMKKFLAESDEDRLGYGRPIGQVLMSETWRRTITPDSHAELARQLSPYFRDIPGEALPPEVSGGPLRPDGPSTAPPALLVGEFGYADLGKPSFPVRYLAATLREPTGRLIGTLIVTDMAAPTSLVSLLAQGDRAMHERMADLVTPAPQAAGILFADLPSSTELARRLPTSVYFELIRRLTATFDETVSMHTGVIGKHAGDGMTAFFLASQIGGREDAAAVALTTAAQLQRAATDIMDESLDDRVASDWPRRFNIGIHWGANLYMGQLVPRSRLEVTALGDEVNQCARIEECASNLPHESGVRGGTPMDHVPEVVEK